MADESSFFGDQIEFMQMSAKDKAKNRLTSLLELHNDTKINRATAFKLLGVNVRDGTYRRAWSELHPEEKPYPPVKLTKTEHDNLIDTELITLRLVDNHGNVHTRMIAPELFNPVHHENGKVYESVDLFEPVWRGRSIMLEKP